MCVHLLCMCAHELMQVSAAKGAWGVPRGCLVCTWQGIKAQKKSMCVKHTPIDQNMSSMFNQKETQELELIRVQFNTRMSLGHSVKHLACNRAQHQ